MNTSQQFLLDSCICTDVVDVVLQGVEQLDAVSLVKSPSRKFLDSTEYFKTEEFVTFVSSSTAQMGTRLSGRDSSINISSHSAKLLLIVRSSSECTSWLKLTYNSLPV